MAYGAYAAHQENLSGLPGVSATAAGLALQSTHPENTVCMCGIHARTF